MARNCMISPGSWISDITASHSMRAVIEDAGAGRRWCRLSAKRMKSVLPRHPCSTTANHSKTLRRAWGHPQKNSLSRQLGLQGLRHLRCRLTPQRFTDEAAGGGDRVEVDAVRDAQP